MQLPAKEMKRAIAGLTVFEGWVNLSVNDVGLGSARRVYPLPPVGWW